MTVLLLVDDPRLTDALRQCQLSFHDSPSLQGVKGDILAIAKAGEFPLLPKSVGRIAIGSDPTADVSLAEDFTEREVQLACQLLGHIVRMRRARRRSRRLHRALAVQAQTDPLTNLPNRRAWDSTLGPRLAAAREAGLGVALALFDVDQFKDVNTRHGLPIGDRVLQHVGHALAAGVRGGDFVARLGGDEFGLVLTGVTDHNLAEILERLRARIAAAIEPGVPAVTVSVGFAFVPAGEVGHAEPLIAAADEALRLAKSSGRNRAVKAGPHP